MKHRRSLTNADVASGSPAERDYVGAADWDYVGAADWDYVGAADWDYAWDEVWNTADPVAAQDRPAGRSHRTLWTIGCGGLIIVLVAGSYAGSAWLAADGMLHALGRRDVVYLTAHLDAAKLLAGLDQDLRHLAAQSAAGRDRGRLRQSAYLDRLARGTASALHSPGNLGLVIQARIMDPGTDREPLELLGNGAQRIVADSLTSFHVDFAADGRPTGGMTLCFALEDLIRLDWRLIQIGWPEFGGACQKGESR